MTRPPLPVQGQQGPNAPWADLLNDAIWDVSDRTDGKVGKGELVFNVKDFGAKGDGVTDDTTAIKSALTAAAGAKLLIPPGVYVVSAALTFSNVRVIGYGATLKYAGSALFLWVTIGTGGATITGVTFSDPSKLITGATFSTSATAGRTELRECTFTGAGTNTITALISSTTAGVLIDRCTFDSVVQAILIRGASQGVTVSRSTIKNWSSRGIYLLGNSEGAPSRVTIDRNVISDMTLGGSARYPIFATKDIATYPLDEISVTYNIVRGPALSYASGGTADQISLSSCDHFKLIGNTSLDSGDMGITVAKDSKHGIVALNECRSSFSSGIAIWTGVNSVAITGNVCMNNGQSKTGTYGQDGIRFSGTGTDASGSNITISGNVLGDDQATPTQQYGVSLRGATHVRLGPDINAGNVKALYAIDPALTSTDITSVSMAAL